MMTRTEIKILLIEDTAADTTFLEVMLQRDPRVDYVITAVDRLGKGLQKIHEEQFGIVLLDLGLPDSQGLDTFRQLKETNMDLPVIVLSGLMDEEVALQAVQLGAQDYIVKGTTGWDSLSRSIRYAIERKQTERALLESETRFRTLFENSPIAVWEEDFSQLKIYLDTLQKSGVGDLEAYLNQHDEVVYECIQIVRVKDVNRAALDMYEVANKADLLGSLEKTLPPESLTSFKRELLTIARGETAFRAETSLRTPKGKVKDVTINWATAPGYEQTYAKVLVSLVDITASKQTEEKLRRSEEQYRYLFENNPLPMWAFDRETRAFLAVNDAAIEKYGYSRAEFLSMTLADIRPPEDLERFNQNRNYPYSPMYQSDEWRHKLKDGKIIDVEITSHQLTLHDREAMLVVAQDITERKQAQENLRKSEARLAAFFENSPVAIGISRVRDGKISHINRAFAELYEFTPEEMIGRTAAELNIWADPTERLQFIELLEADKHVRSFEAVARLRSGTLRNVLVSGELIENDAEPSLLAQIIDITERKQAEEELKKRDLLLAEAQRIGRIGHIEWDNTTHLLNCSDEVYEILEIPRGIALTQQSLTSMAAPEEAARLHELDLKAFAEQKDLDYEFSIRLSGGRTRWLRQRAAITYGVDGKPARMIGTLQDITEHKQAEAAIRNNEQRFRALIENGLDYISLLDARGNLLWESPSSTTLLGFKFNEFIGHSIFDLVHPEDKHWILQQFSELADHPAHRIAGIFRLQRSDGSWRWVEAIASNFLHEPSVNAIVINYRDITERKQTQDELQQRNVDLALVNSMNEAVIHGESLHNVIHLLSDDLMKNFGCEGVSLYLVNAEKNALALQHYLLVPNVQTQMERLLSSTIPLITIPLRAGSFFHKCLHASQSLLISEPGELVGWLTEFLEAVNQVTGNPQAETEIMTIYNSRGIKSVISIPLLFDEQPIGLLNLSSSNLFTTTDLERVSHLSRQLTAAIQRQQADERVRQSEEFLNSVQNALSAHIAILDQQGTIVKVNAAWRKFAEQNGYEHPHYGVGVNYLEVCDTAVGINSENAQEVAYAIRQVLSGARREARVEYPCHGPEEHRWFILRITSFTNGDRTWVVLAHENITYRKQAEEAIRRSQSILAQAGTMAHLGAWEIEVSDPEHINSNPARWSDEVYRILGYEPGSVTASNDLFFEHVHPADRPKLAAAMQAAVNRHEAYAVEHRILQANGTVRILEEHANLIYDPHGRLIQVLGAVQDVTEHKQIEASLKRTSEQFRVLFEASPEAILLIDPHDDWLIVDCNDAACMMNGYERAELIGHSIDTLTLAHRNDSGRAEYLEAIRKAGILRYDDFHRRKDGTVFPIEVSTSIIQFGDRELVLGLDRDITERKNAEKALRESEALYRQAIEVGDGVPYRETYYNNGLSIHYDFIGDGIRQITGYGPDEFNATIWESLVEEAHLIEDLEEYSVEEGIRRVRAGEDPVWKCEFRIHDRNGKIHWVLEAAVELRDESGTSHGSIGMFQDITIRKQAEEALRISAEENQAIINAVPDLLFRIDQTGIIVGYHARDMDELYVGPEAFLGRSLLEVLPAHVSEPAMAAMHKAISTGHTVAFEYEMRLHGTRKFYENRIVPRSNNEVLSIIRDITDRIQAEQALKESEERYRNLVDQLPVIVYTDQLMDGVGITQYISPQVEAVTGFGIQEWLAGGFELWKQQIHPKDREQVVAQYLHCLGHSEPFELEYRLHTKSGESIWVHDQFQISFDAQHQPVSSHGIMYDISERKQAEEDRQRRLAEFEALYENGLAISKLLDPKLISDKVVGILADKLHWHHAAIRLFHAETNSLELVALNHPGLSEQELREQIDRLNSLISDPNKGLTGLAIRQHTPVRSGDLNADPRYIETYPGMRSGLYVPIMAGERTLGAISVESDVENAFSVQDERLLSTLANQAAVAIENAQLYLLVQKELDERQQAEERLRESEARQNGIIEAAMDAIITIDEKQHVVLFNAAAEKIFGCPVAEALGQPVARFIPERLRAQHEDYVRQFGLSDTTTRYMRPHTEGIGLRVDGTEFPLEASISQITVAGTKLYTVILRDITERKKAEDELRQSEENYRLLFELSPEGIITHNGRDITFVNAAAAKLIGAPTSQELIGRPVLQFVHPDHHKLAIERIQKQSRGERILPQEEKFIRIDGSILDVEVNAAPIRTQGNSAFLVTLRDITERKRAEEALRQSEEKYRYLAADLERRVDERTAEVQDLYNNAPCGYHSLDANGIITRINETELKWLGYTREEVLNQPFMKFLTPESQAIFQQSFSVFKQQGAVRDLEFDLVRKGNLTMPIVVSATAVYDSQGNYVSSRSTLFDNTDRKSALETLRLANAEMQRALRTKDEFLANMSHELRTPLNAILGLSESLLEQTAGGLNEKQQKYLTTINESGSHLLELINDILDLAKVEAGQIKLDPAKVDINNVCQASLRMIKQLAHKKQQTVEINIEKNIGYIWADERRLKQMLVNLLSNAVKFTPVGGSIGLSAQLDDHESKLLLSIWDNGIGIPNEELPRLFKPFVQLDSSLSREISGTGLGLALVAQMARLHGGSISVTSVPGQGSRFTIVLPWDPALTSETLEKLKITGRFPVIKSLPGKPKTILLVEDTDSVVMLVKDYLELSGYKVELARDGVSGVSKALASHPDLILMDVQMPGMDGFEATRRIRQEAALRHTPIIALTALAMINDRERCLEAGMNDYVSKPVNLRQLVKTIQAYLTDPVIGEAL